MMGVERCGGWRMDGTEGVVRCEYVKGVLINVVVWGNGYGEGLVYGWGGMDL